MDDIKQYIKVKVENEKPNHNKKINIIDLFFSSSLLTSETHSTFKIQKLIKKHYETEDVESSYINYLNNTLNHNQQTVISCPFQYHQTSLFNRQNEGVSLDYYYQFIISSGQDCYHFLSEFPLFKRSTLQSHLIQKREKFEYITSLDSQDSKNFMKYVLNSSGQEVLNKYNKNTKVASLKLFYILNNDMMKEFELDKNDVQYNSFIVSVDIFIKYLSHAFITLYPVNLIGNGSNHEVVTDNPNRSEMVVGIGIKKEEKEKRGSRSNSYNPIFDQEDLDATLVNKRNYEAIADSTNQTVIGNCKEEGVQGSGLRPIKKQKTSNNEKETVSSTKERKVQFSESQQPKPKPPLLRVMDDHLNLNYTSVHGLSISEIGGQGQLLFMRENVEKDQYLYIFSSNFALNMASQSYYFDLDVKEKFVYKHKYQGHFDYYSIKAYNNNSVDHSFDQFENYFYRKEDKKKIKNFGTPVIYALCRNIESSLALKIILFVLRMNLKYDKVKIDDNHSPTATTASSKKNNQSSEGGKNNQSSEGGKNNQSLEGSGNDEIYFNDRTGLSFLNKDFPADRYHYLWLKDDFITHPTTTFNMNKKGKMNRKEKFTRGNESLRDPENFSSSSSFGQLVHLKFTNEKLNPTTTNYDLVRFNDSNFKVLNQDEFIITIPITPTLDANDHDDALNQKNNLAREDILNRKQFLLMKPSSVFVSASYQMNFTPIVSINYITRQLRRDMIQNINQQFYASPEEFITFSRKFNRLDHQNTLTIKDFISFPSILFVFALKLFYIAPSPKGFALLRLLLMVHIKKQTFLNPPFNNKDFNFFVRAFDNIFTNIKEIWGGYYDQIITQQNYIIHPQFFYKKTHQDLFHIFLDKRYTRKTLSLRSFVNILFGEEVVKSFNKDKKVDISHGYDQLEGIDNIVEDIKGPPHGTGGVENPGINDHKSLFKYFSTLYTNQCIAHYLIHRQTLDLFRSSTSSKNKTKSKSKRKGKNRYGNNPLIYYQGLYLFLSRKIKKLFVVDKDKKANYYLIEDMFRAMDPYGSEEEEIEKEGLGEAVIEEEEQQQQQQQGEGIKKKNYSKKGYSLSKALQISIFRPFILDIFNIHCLCPFCCPTLTDREREKYSTNSNEPDSHYHQGNSSSSQRKVANQHRHRLCAYQILKILLSQSLTSPSSSSSSSSSSISTLTTDYFLMEKYNNKIENLYIQNEFSSSSSSSVPSSSTTTTTSIFLKNYSSHHQHHHNYDKKWQKLIKEKGIEQFFSHPQLYDMDTREEEAIRESLMFFRKYETAIIDRLSSEKGIQKSSNKNSSSQSQNSISSSQSSSSFTAKTSTSHKPIRIICRVEKYNRRSSLVRNNEDINFERLLDVFNKNRSNYRCTCYEYLYSSGHYLCRHIIAGQLNSIYESHKERESIVLGTMTSQLYRYHSKAVQPSPSPSQKKFSLLEMKRRKYLAFPFLKPLELQLLNIIKKERLNKISH